MGCLQVSELKSPRRIKLSYFDESKSRFLSMLSRCLLITFLFGLYEQHNNILFPLYLTQHKMLRNWDLFSIELTEHYLL